MKKVFMAVLVVLAGVGMTTLSQAAGGAGITGSKHDLSIGKAAGTEKCIFCHTPHGASGEEKTPLWNHKMSDVTDYAMYKNIASIDATIDTQPTGVSKLCLSCHDGTVALDSFGTVVGTEFISTSGTGSGNLGKNLMKSHPISFDYSNKLIEDDTELHNRPTWFKDGDVRFECSSCHDVHDKAASSGMLHVSNKSSELCLTCHDK